MTNDSSPEKSGGGHCNSFNYCLVAKLLVAVPVLPLIAIVAASYFTHPLVQLVAALLAVSLTIYAARLFDRLPIFSKPVVTRKK